MFKDELGKIEANGEVVIFGAGKVGHTIFSFLEENVNCRQIAFCDNSELLQRKYFEYDVYSLGEAISRFPKAVYVLAGENHIDIMKNELLSQGINENQIVNGCTEDIIRARDSRFNFHDDRDRSIPLSKIRFEINCAEHCNLNCIGCSTFASLAKDEFVDVDELTKDLERMSGIFGGECESIYLIGGEPLLHPLLGEVVTLSRKFFPIGEISIFTNGVLLEKQSKNLWKICRENNVSVVITKYPLMMNYKVLTDMLEDEGIAWSWAFSDDGIKVMECSNLDSRGEQNPVYSFTHCSEANNCIKLKHGKLYTCTLVSSIYKFNRAFNQNFIVLPEDSIDIYSNITAEEIFRKLSQPIPFCRYCDKKTEPRKFKWQPSKNRMDEWLVKKE